MSVRTVLIVVLALVFGGSAAIGIGSFYKAPTAAPVDTVPVVVAAADVPRFSTVTPDLLRTRDFPKNLVPPGALTSPEEAADRVTYAPLVKDEPILDSKLAPKGAGRGMAAAIPKGMRAFTIQTPSISAGVAGFILPGNKVDVLLTVNGRANDANASTVTLLQGIEILAVDQLLEAPAENKVSVKELRSVTLLVTPDQAAKLNLGQNKGTLHLALRNPDDRAPAGAGRATLTDLGLPEPPREQPRAEKKPQPPPGPKVPPRAWVRTLRGNSEGGVYIVPPEGTPDDEP